MNPELARLLRHAAKDIEVVASEMDRSEDPCQHCGTKRKINWNEYQMGVELDAIVTKLLRFAKTGTPTKER
jgi:hypothetical protein